MHNSFIFIIFAYNIKRMKNNNNKTKYTHRTMHGTIVDAGRILDFRTSRGKSNQSAMLHIQEDENDPSSAQLAVKVTGDMCNYVGCIGAHVVVEYVIRVFDFVKNGIKTFGNDVYATSIRMI